MKYKYTGADLFFAIIVFAIGFFLLMALTASYALFWLWLLRRIGILVAVLLILMGAGYGRHVWRHL